MLEGSLAAGALAPLGPSLAGRLLRLRDRLIANARMLERRLRRANIAVVDPHTGLPRRPGRPKGSLNRFPHAAAPGAG